MRCLIIPEIITQTSSCFLVLIFGPKVMPSTVSRWNSITPPSPISKAIPLTILGLMVKHSLALSAQGEWTLPSGQIGSTLGDETCILFPTSMIQRASIHLSLRGGTIGTVLSMVLCPGK